MRVAFISHADCGRVQDPYTLRCAPQVLGAVADALEYVAGAIERELGAVTDNPLVFEDAILSVIKEAWADRIRAVTADEVKAAANKYLSRNHVDARLLPAGRP